VTSCEASSWFFIRALAKKASLSAKLPKELSNLKSCQGNSGWIPETRVAKSLCTSLKTGHLGWSTEMNHTIHKDKNLCQELRVVQSFFAIAAMVTRLSTLTDLARSPYCRERGWIDTTTRQREGALRPRRVGQPRQTLAQSAFARTARVNKTGLTHLSSGKCRGTI